jgi:rare lipoprotein A
MGRFKGISAMKWLPAVVVILLLNGLTNTGYAAPPSGIASWYGEEHRGMPMANGRKFDPDKFTAASWFYPLGTRVRVTLASESDLPHPTSVVVTITDRGPARRLVRAGRIIDLARAAFKAIADPAMGLVDVTVEPLAVP